MTLLSDIVKVLHEAEVTSYCVHTAVHDRPGAPDLVVTTEGDAERARGALLVAVRSIWRVRQVSEQVIHVWAVPAA